MPNEKGWPDAANPGFPSKPDQEGPHYIRDQYGERRWYFWLPVGTLWFSGSFNAHPRLRLNTGPTLELQLRPTWEPNPRS